jgi:hypothetical protein
MATSQQHAGDESRPGVLGSAALTTITRRAVRRRGARLVQWRAVPIPYANYYGNRALFRIEGTAEAEGDTLSWSAVLKVLRPPPEVRLGSEPIIWDREARAYRSGLLTQLPGGLAAPRVLLLERSDDGEVRLWLEDVADAHGRTWPLSQYAIAARHLGRFNGAYLTSRPLPNHRWLNRLWAEGHADPQRLPAARQEIEALLSHLDARGMVQPSQGKRVMRLLDDQPRIIEALARLPQTLCHHDASSANLFARLRGPGRSEDDADAWETVAIDWEELGPGPIGAEIATLVLGSMRRGDFPADRAAELAHTAIDSYERGLRDAGWDGTSDTIRFGFNAAVALRWFVVRGALRLLADPTDRASLPNPEEELHRRLTVMRFLLDCTGEALNAPPLTR